MKSHISPREMSDFIRGKLPKNFLCAPDKEMMKRSFPPRLLSRSDKRAGNIFLLFIFPGQETNFHPSAFSTTHFLTLITFNHDITTFLRNAHQHYTHPILSGPKNLCRTDHLAKLNTPIGTPNPITTNANVNG